MPSSSTDRVSFTSHAMLRRALLGCAIAVAMVVVAGCNTVAGAGKDVQAAGSGIEGAAEKAKD